jgi:hypothetical protein
MRFAGGHSCLRVCLCAHLFVSLYIRIFVVCLPRNACLPWLGEHCIHVCLYCIHVYYTYVFIVCLKGHACSPWLGEVSVEVCTYIHTH